MQALSDAIGGIAGILTVEDVLQLIVDRVRELVGAKYAALGILAETGVGSSGSSRVASPQSSAGCSAIRRRATASWA